jgi:hypothetical protein
MKNKKLLAAVLCCTMFVAGCGVWSSIVKWEPFALQAFTYVVSILQAGGAINAGQQNALSADAAIANADFGDLASVVTDYQNAPAADKLTKLGKVVTLLDVLQAHLRQIEFDTHLNSATDQEAVRLALEGMITTVLLFRTELAPVAAGRKSMSQAVLPSPYDFKNRFNQIMRDHGYPDKQIK